MHPSLVRARQPQGTIFILEHTSKSTYLELLDSRGYWGLAQPQVMINNHPGCRGLQVEGTRNQWRFPPLLATLHFCASNWPLSSPFSAQ